MAKLNNTVITNKGRNLMAKLLAGTAETTFTKIVLSDREYSQSQLASLTSIASIKQSTLVSRVIRASDSVVQVEAGINNAKLSAGYFINTIGLYATDPDEGEILYSVTTADEADHMPQYGGVTDSSVIFKMITNVSNSSNVSLEVSPAALATALDLQRVESTIETHMDSNKPHSITDVTNDKKYMVGLEIHEGQPRLIYKEA